MQKKRLNCTFGLLSFQKLRL